MELSISQSRCGVLIGIRREPGMVSARCWSLTINTTFGFLLEAVTLLGYCPAPIENVNAKMAG